MEKDTKRIRDELQGTLSCLDFSYIWSLFLVANNKSLTLHHGKIQKRKLENLLGADYMEIFWNFNSVRRVEIFAIILEVSSQDENLKILILMKIIFWINGFFYHPGMNLKLRLYGEKWCFIPEWKFQLGVS